MGWRFPLKYANVVSYLTSPKPSQPPPRLTDSELFEFLGSLQAEYRERSPLISSDQNWIGRTVRAAKRSKEKLESFNRVSRLADAHLDESVTRDLLSELRELLGNYELFGLTVGDYASNQQLRAFVDFAAYSSKHHAIFLSPDLEDSSQAFEVLDPFPAICLISEQPENWPGILFWSKTGATTFAKLADAYDLYNRLLKAFEEDNSLRRIDAILDTYRTKRSKKLLHLSDLHFGNDDAVEKEAYLSGHLEPLLKETDRVVITGDLFNSPKREEALAFRNFRASLQRKTGKDPIVIPGNHDQKWLGNFGSPLKELANLEWSNLVSDDDMRCVFFCFDSSRDADLARGKVTKQQMLEVATLFVTRAAANPQLHEYLPITLIHHHPFSFETPKERIIDRALERLGITDEYFLRMDDADAFLAWCARRGVQVILHGHKHVPRHTNQWVQFDQQYQEIVAVGCGTSLGAEGKPLSYNLVSWDPASRKWSVSFFADAGDGSGFSRQYIALHTAPNLSVPATFS